MDKWQKSGEMSSLGSQLFTQVMRRQHYNVSGGRTTPMVYAVRCGSPAAAAARCVLLCLIRWRVLLNVVRMQCMLVVGIIADSLLEWWAVYGNRRCSSRWYGSGRGINGVQHFSMSSYTCRTPRLAGCAAMQLLMLLKLHYYPTCWDWFRFCTVASKSPKCRKDIKRRSPLPEDMRLKVFSDRVGQIVFAQRWCQAKLSHITSPLKAPLSWWRLCDG